MHGIRKLEAATTEETKIRSAGWYQEDCVLQEPSKPCEGLEREENDEE